MLYELLITLYVFVCILLILVILIQKGKSNLGIGALSGSSQMLFGGSGGQDLFQRITWILGTIFMAGSLVLAIMRTHYYQSGSYFRTRMPQASAAPQTTGTPEAPTATTES